jgi:phosphatidylserine/phosphatidylglycerophosphate/cardiolipin synthase-like enzyme
MRFAARAFLLSLFLAACSGGPPSDQPESADPLESDATSSKVRVIVMPGDDGAALIAAINAATVSVHMTMYLLSDSGVMDALVARHKAGVEVKVILNQVVHSSGGAQTPNEKAFAALQAAGIPVVWAPSSFAITHEKTVVIDGATAWIMTMNAATASLRKNREYLAVDTTAADVTEAEAQFAADFAGTPFTPSGSLVVAPVNARESLLALVNGAKTSLDIEAEELSDTAFTTAMCDAVGRSVTTRVVLSNRTASSAQKKAVTDLKTCGVQVGSLAHPYIHAKAIVVDKKRAYVGSANLTRDSLDRNRELGLITSAKAAVSPVAETVATDIAAATPL